MRHNPVRWTAMRPETGISQLVHRPHSGPGRAERGKKTLGTSRGLWGIKGRALGWWIAIGIAVTTQTSLIGQVPTVAPSTLVRAPTIQPPPSGEIEVLPIRGNIYALLGAGANIVASVGPDGVML